MQDEKNNLEDQAAPMGKRRETMADGRRYIIYYTFENDSGSAVKNLEGQGDKAEASENV